MSGEKLGPVQEYQWEHTMPGVPVSELALLATTIAHDGMEIQVFRGPDGTTYFGSYHDWETIQLGASSDSGSKPEQPLPF